VRGGARAGKEFRLQEVTNVGRDATQNDIAIDDTAISRQHARVKLEDGKFVLYDLASANGTSVNGQKILKHELANGDQVTMGETQFTFMQVASA
jgi:pSer/pThr/pTyr-binding forkhead associated (FHA) protein